MSISIDFIVQLVSTLAGILSLATFFGGLFTFIYRRTVREQDDTVAELRDIKAEHIRLSSETSRNTDFWELSQHVHAESVKATNGQVEAVTVRLQFIEGQVAELNGQLSKLKNDQDKLEESCEEVRRSLDEVQGGLEDLKVDCDGINLGQ